MDKLKLSDAEEVELEFKRLQIEQLREQIAERTEKKERLASDRRRQVEDWKKGEEIKARRQSRCRHRKGGKDNRFWNGNDANYSIITNTYPTGEIVMMCTRCFKEVPKPDPRLKKTDPKKYAALWEEWKVWSQFPTDNTPSGSKIFELISA